MKDKTKLITFRIVLILAFAFLLWYAFSPNENKINNSIPNEELIIPSDNNYNSLSSLDFLTTKDEFSNTYQIHYDHMPVTYNYNEECANYFNGKYPDQIKRALDYITNKTDQAITFEKTDSSKPDIMYNCDFEHGRRNPLDLTIAEAFENYYENIYTFSEIRIYSTEMCLGKKPVTLIHETLHLFGLQHFGYVDYDTPSGYPLQVGEENVMHQETTNCFADISQEDINYLKTIYQK